MIEIKSVKLDADEKIKSVRHSSCFRLPKNGMRN